MMHTDEQIIRVARWLGFKVTTEVYGVGGSEKWVVIETAKCRYDLCDFRRWLRSPEGRCAIEDKFIEATLDGVYCALFPWKNSGGMPYLVEKFNSEGRVATIGEGPTIAEAWLKAAVKYTEEMK